LAWRFGVEVGRLLGVVVGLTMFPCTHSACRAGVTVKKLLLTEKVRQIFLKGEDED